MTMLGALLLPWLKANAEEMARELRDAGWGGDERGLWTLPAASGWTNAFDGLEDTWRR